jgi:hypothetical protein
VIQPVATQVSLCKRRQRIGAIEGALELSEKLTFAGTGCLRDWAGRSDWGWRDGE